MYSLLQTSYHYFNWEGFWDSSWVESGVSSCECASSQVRRYSRCYCLPPSSDCTFRFFFFAKIEDLLSAIDRCVLMGDFNYNLRDSDGDADFVQKLTSLGFHLPRFHNAYMDHHGHFELDGYISFLWSHGTPAWNWLISTCRGPCPSNCKLPRGSPAWFLSRNTTANDTKLVQIHSVCLFISASRSGLDYVEQYSNYVGFGGYFVWKLMSAPNLCAPLVPIS